MDFIIRSALERILCKMSVEEELEQNVRMKSNKLVSYDIYLKLVMESDMVLLKSMKSGYSPSDLSAPEKKRQICCV